MYQSIKDELLAALTKVNNASNMLKAFEEYNPDTPEGVQHAIITEAISDKCRDMTLDVFLGEEAITFGPLGHGPDSDDYDG